MSRNPNVGKYPQICGSLYELYVKAICNVISRLKILQTHSNPWIILISMVSYMCIKFTLEYLQIFAISWLLFIPCLLCLFSFFNSMWLLTSTQCWMWFTSYKRLGTTVLENVFFLSDFYGDTSMATIYRAITWLWVWDVQLLSIHSYYLYSETFKSI